MTMKKQRRKYRRKQRSESAAVSTAASNSESAAVSTAASNSESAAVSTAASNSESAAVSTMYYVSGDVDEDMMDDETQNIDELIAGLKNYPAFSGAELTRAATYKTGAPIVEPNMLFVPLQSLGFHGIFSGLKSVITRIFISMGCYPVDFMVEIAKRREDKFINEVNMTPLARELKLHGTVLDVAERHGRRNLMCSLESMGAVSHNCDNIDLNVSSVTTHDELRFLMWWYGIQAMWCTKHDDDVCGSPGLAYDSCAAIGAYIDMSWVQTHLGKQNCTSDQEFIHTSNKVRWLSSIAYGFGYTVCDVGRPINQFALRYYLKQGILPLFNDVNGDSIISTAGKEGVFNTIVHTDADPELCGTPLDVVVRRKKYPNLVGVLRMFGAKTADELRASAVPPRAREMRGEEVIAEMENWKRLSARLVVDNIAIVNKEEARTELRINTSIDVRKWTHHARYSMSVLAKYQAKDAM